MTTPGTAWTGSPSSTLSGPSGTDFESVVALSPADVWVGGTNGTGPLLEHFDGTSWQVMTTPSSFAGAGVFAIAARSDSDVWHPRGVILIRVLVTAWALALTGILLASGYWGWALLTLAGAVANGVLAYRVFRPARH